MERLTRLQARIATLDELRELVRAMRVLAANHVQSAQGALAGIRKYAEVIEDGIAEGMTLVDDGLLTMKPATGIQEVVIGIFSEHGFVGRFNERLLDQLVEQLDHSAAVAAVGGRGVALAAERGVRLLWHEQMATQIGAVLGVARRVAARLVGEQRVRIVHARYLRGGDYAIESHVVLPLDPQVLNRTGVRSQPLHHLPVDRLLTRLADEYLLAEITRSLMESFASESAARLRVMESADRNIQDRLAIMDQRVHALRQEAITAELLDLITGAAASESRGVRTQRT